MPDAATIALASAIAAGLSATVGIVTVVVNLRNARKASASSIKAAESAERSIQISMGQAESGLRVTITDCRERYEDVCLQMEGVARGRLPTALSADEKRHIKAIDIRRASSLEAVANAYETACMQYIDGKVDKDRFKISYHVEVRMLVENKELSFQRLFHPKDTSRYKAVWRVYNLWNDIEKNPA